VRKVRREGSLRFRQNNGHQYKKSMIGEFMSL
jgi:hypothetical protein